ncbi:MAG: glycosyltransferase family 39 protein [Deltaproteobacteria bacterium]|jgi:4-amino-4-deoxy-L-arabinose transferase-like glycosyltransferase|nr:glycosyltransferase family 39 protein [Deltaproteobacteria bacterium]MBW2535878.1 glycosyltransferase family 39 protein [Deltaproteobacteria bacterium]
MTETSDPALDPDGAPSSADREDAADREPLVPPGNPLRLRAVVPVVLGTVAGVAVMATELSPRTVVPIAAGAVLLVVAGLLDLVGSFDDGRWPTETTVRWSRLALPVGVAAAGIVAQLLLLRLAVAGRLPLVGSAVGMPLAFLTTVGAIYVAGARLGPWRYDEDGLERPLWRRHGFWVVALTVLLYLPMLGNHSLSDPWETHYGEVAREILARNDWISLWWAQDGWFWSKPVLTFWIQAIPMALLGVRYEPGAMLSAVADGLEPQPEWAVRMPIFLLALLAHYLIYKAVARTHGRRAGLLSAVVLMTMPQWFLIAHQTMTDLPFAACMTAGLALFLWGLGTDSEQRVTVYEVSFGSRRLGLSLFHLVMGAILVLVVPQVLYLASRNLSLLFDPQVQLLVHGDSFWSGSAGNCGLPGNKACQQDLLPTVKGMQPAVQALIWVQALALLLWMSWGERRRQRLLYLAAWLMLALATMAKGPAGIGLPVLAALCYVMVSGRWRELSRMEIVAGLLIFVAVVLPWFVVMYSRHGQPFTDRLLFHDMFKRAFKHVHDTNKGEDLSFRYYLWQLGYAAFPWTGLTAAGLVAWLRHRRPLAHPRSALPFTMLAWFALGFAVFASMGTKFHHYCLPIVPPMAVLTGLLLDELIRSAEPVGRGARGELATDALDRRITRALLGALALGGAVLTFFVGRDLAWDAPGRLSGIRLMHLFTYNYGRPWPKSVDYSAELWAFTIAAAVIVGLLVLVRIRQQVALALCAVGTLFAGWGLNDYLVELSPHWGQRELYLRYEQERLAAPGPLIAYQLNWKGENFYRGNEVPAFVSSGAKFKEWIAEQQKERDVDVFYFVTEHGRTGGLSRELGSPSQFEKLTTKELNNKFVLVRVTFS